MKPQLRTQRGNIGNEIFIRVPDFSMYPSTILTADANSGVSSYTTKDSSFLSSNDYIISGIPGTPATEINQVNSVSSGTTISLVSSTSFPHNQTTRITYIPFNQVRIEKSTDAGSTYSTVTTVNLKVNNPEHYYNDTTGSENDYYRIRFVNSNNSTSSDPSDGVIATGYADNTVFAIKKRAVESSGMKLSDIYAPDAIITDSFLNEALFELRRVAHRYSSENEKGQKRWSFRQVYDYRLGSVSSGTNRIALPATMDNTNVMKNLYQVRIGDRMPIYPVSKERWNQLQVNRRHTTLASAITSTSDVTVTLTNSGDFDDSGSISIIESGTQDDISYTSNTEGTGVLSGVTGIDATHSSDIDVWQNPSFGLPTYYTVFGGYIYFDCPFASDYEAEGIYIDFYKYVPAVDSDSDELDEIDYDMFVPGLKAKIRQARNNGVQSSVNENDPDWREFNNRISQMAGSDTIDRDIIFIPYDNSW